MESVRNLPPKSLEKLRPFVTVTQATSESWAKADQERSELDEHVNTNYRRNDVPGEKLVFQLERQQNPCKRYNHQEYVKDSL
mmetsp:Transcript_103043/g.193888  ORF Transcript_103043/g.193888 Transcript_103043/m.193888 type:complete len:82 (-) Transcript_103043:58-303(-)